MTARAERVRARVRAVPEGFVTCYGDLDPGAPRFAGAVLATSDDTDLPWWRVVRADGSLPKGDRQRSLLEREGIPFVGARVDMNTAHIAGLSSDIRPHEKERCDIPRKNSDETW